VSVLLYLLARTGIAAGSPIPIDLMRQLIARMNLRDLTIAYGMSRSCAPFHVGLCMLFSVRALNLIYAHPFA
jgi:acyl-CoA synthetase (AMP-forming)/AMP-acid ligase II